MEDKRQAGQPPRVFVSYSWDTEEHKKRVRQLATQLREHGIDARLDAWHLKGRTIPSFMNSEVRNADFILAVCSPGYRQKVHAAEDGDRSTGSGWEMEVITGLQFNDNRNKTVPVLMSGAWAEAAPDFLLSYPYFDLSSSEQEAESEYRRLREKLMGQEPVAPPLGIPPESSEEAVAPLFETKTAERMALAADLAPNTFLLSAASAEESVIDLAEGGVFTKHLVEGLAGAADLDADGTVSARELVEYVTHQIANERWERETGVPAPICYIQSEADYPFMGEGSLRAYSEVSGVIVGINQYDAGFNLQSCVSDAQKVFRVFQSTGLDASRLSLLTDKEASRDAIAAEFLRKAINARADSLLVFYFAGTKVGDKTGNVGLGANDSVNFDSTLKVDVLKALFKVSAAKVGALLLDA